ncbi:hypothetical protein [Nonomuraea africana]|uniref:hypothetical protein n=1 Tax=Nonomuraea africana TaxID=46171 RepID=UPI0033C3FDF6
MPYRTLARLCLGLFALLPLLVGAASSTAGAAVERRVAVVGVPGLQWSDLDQARTPHLWKLVGGGAAASLSTRVVPPPNRGTSCPMAGWLTVSAGQRAGAPGCVMPGAPTAGAVPGWAELTAFQAGTGYDAVLGTLGQTVEDAGGRVAAVGPGAALGAANRSGKVGAYADAPEGLADPASYDLIVMEADQLARAWTALPADRDGVPPDLAVAARQAAAAAADRSIGAFLDRLPAGTTVLVAGLSDTSTAAHLHVALAHGGPYRHGFLTATSTRQDALVTITDLTATAIRNLGLTVPAGVVGRAWENGGEAPPTVAETVTRLADEDLASQVLREVRGPFFAVFVAVQVLFYAVAALVLRRRRSALGADAPVEDAASSRVLAAVQVVAVVSGAVAVSTFLAQLVPWWSLPAAMPALIGTILAFAGLITALAFAGPWRAHVLGPLTVVAGVTSVALLLDVMTGSRLQVNAVTGYEPVTGGRFYGFSNIAFAVYATGTVLALAGIAQWLLGRLRRIVVVLLCAAYGAFAVFADGWPGWGADFGGVPAFVIGLAVFLILLSGRRVSLVKLLLVGLAGAVLIGAIAFADWLRAADQRTHLGTFVQQIIDGQALTVVWRKFSSMIGITVGNWQLTLLSLVALAFLFFVLDRPSRWGASALGRAYGLAPTLRAGLFGALTCAFVGFLVNDSGIAIPAMALTVAVPLTLAACVRALQLATPTTPDPPSAPAATTAPPAA